MSRSLRVCTLFAVIGFCLAILCLSTSGGEDRKPYEIQTQVYGVSAGRSDAARAIDAYERLMQRYTDLTEQNFARVTTDLDTLARKLDAIDAKLTILDARVAGIERHLGLKSTASVANPNAPPMPAPSFANALPAPNLP
jgi:hypothetical protein